MRSVLIRSRQTLPKLLVIALALTASCWLTDRASAAPTKILNHSANEIEAYCNKIGGTFRWDTEKYYCVKPDNSGIIVCYWGSNTCYSNRKTASSTGTANPNTRNLGSAPKPPAKTNVTGGAIAAPGRVTTATGIARSGGVTAAPAKPAPASPAPTLGGGAFGDMSPTMPGLVGAARRTPQKLENLVSAESESSHAQTSDRYCRGVLCSLCGDLDTGRAGATTAHCESRSEKILR